LGRVVGVEVHAVTTAVGAFFAGLALGSAWLGRLADRWRSPIRLYAALEAGVAILGIVTTLALDRSAPLFIGLEDTLGPLAWALPFVLVGLPSFLMGGTLPALVRAIGPGILDVASATGRLYAANTAGAVLGTLATPFLLIPTFGIRGTGLFAGIVGAGIAIAALTVDRRARAARDVPAPAQSARLSRQARLAIAIYTLAGAAALGYQVVWSELLVPLLSTRAYAFAVMLATYLSGLALGSWLFARIHRERRDPWRVFGLLLATAGLSAIGSVMIMGSWIPDAQTFAGMWAMRLSGSESVEVLARFLVASCAVLLVPTTLLGAAFPAAARLAAGPERVGSDVGRVAGWNTAGGIGGTVLTGFVLVPWLGLVRSLGVLSLVGAALGGLAILQSTQQRGRSRAVALVMIGSVAAVAYVAPSDRMARLLADEKGGELVFYDEGVGGTVAVLEQPAGTAGDTFRRLYIQGVSNSGDALTSLRYMRLQALLPLILHPGEPRSALVVGLGTGITAGALLADSALETRVVAELLPAVVNAATHFSGNFGAASDSRIEIRVVDGRQEILQREQRYDLITLEPPPPSALGVVNLYSRDFYELARERLEPGGIMAQWWPLPTQNVEDSQSLVRSFLDVFPHVTAWSTEFHEVLLVGSVGPIEIDGAHVAGRFAEASIRSALSEVGIESPEALLATFLTGRQGLETFVEKAPPVTDDRPRIEYAAWTRRGEIRRLLPRLLSLASPVPLRSSDPLRAGVEAERRELFGFYRAALLALEGDRDAAVRQLRDVLARDPENPYYRWVALGSS
jgi:spermidine synthase